MNRLRSLDGLRGLAALGVVISHWYFFFPSDGAAWRTYSAPFLWLLTPLYLQGWAAVDLFFTLSGFIFFWLYGEAIRSRSMDGRTFALLRFSRLYPLHFATLVLTYFLQSYFLRSQGHYFVFDHIDWRYFAAQLFLVQSWWPGAPSSFNGVNWSVSLEALLYVVFFLACRCGLRQGLHCFVIALLGALLLAFDEHIARAFIGFFVGGFTFTLWEDCKRSAYATRVMRLSCGAAIAGWALLWFLISTHISWFANGEQNNIFILTFDFIMCPLTVFALALREELRGPSHAIFGFLGDISYAVYLLHFPMLLTLALLGISFGFGLAVFMQGWVMLTFLAALIGISALVYFCFERPSQRWIRRHLKSLVNRQPFGKPWNTDTIEVKPIP